MEPETPVTPAQAAATEYRAQLDTIVDPGQKGSDPEATLTPSGVSPQAAASTTSVESGGISPALIERAIRAGMTAEEAKTVPQSFLTRYVESQERHEEPSPVPAPQPNFKFDPYTGEPVQKAAPKIEWPELPDGDDGFDPRLVKWAKDQRALIESQLSEKDKSLEELRQKLTAQDEMVRQATNEQGFRTLEGLITKDKDFEHVFGEGPAHRHAGTHYIAARQEVAVMMDAIAQAKQKSGQHVPEPEELYGMAKAALYPELIGKTAETKVTNKLADRMRDHQGRLLSKPTATTRSDTYENMAPGPEKAKVGLEILMRNGRMD